MAEPFATILVPTYNHERFIGDALDSLIAQTDRDWEAIVVNDGSTDSTQTILEAYAARDPRFVIIHKPNGGAGSALNAALARARGKWIHWLSSDDMFRADKLELNRRWIEQNPGVNFFFSYFRLYYETTGQIEDRDLWGPLPEPKYHILGMFYRNYISGISICVNREAWAKVGPFDPNNHFSQDTEQWMRLLAKNRAVFIPERLVINRTHPGQGAEIFPAAMYFDAAKATITFLNNHTFREAVPWIDLSQPVEAEAALLKALEAACNPDSLTYFMGPHAGLILRILEWVFGGDVPASARDRLRALVLDRIRAIAFEEGDEDWHWMWRGIAAACVGDIPHFIYGTIEARTLDTREYARRQLGRGGDPEQVRRYLKQFFNIEVSSVLARNSGGSKVVVLADEAAVAFALAAELIRRGYKVLVVAPSEVSFQWCGIVPVMARPRRPVDSFPWLGQVDYAIALDDRPVSPWLEAVTTFSVNAGETADPERLLQMVFEGLGMDGVPIIRRTVALVQLTLWAGGAETVALDVLRNLDRRRFAPIILTLWDARHQRHIVKDIPSVWLQHDSRGPLPAPLLPDPDPEDESTFRQSALHSALHEHWRTAEGLQRAISNLGPDTAVIASMEHAIIGTWLAQTKIRFPYIAWIHTVESVYLPQIWPDPSQHAVQVWSFCSACNSANQIVAPVGFAGADLEENLGITRKISLITNPLACAKVRRLSWAKDSEAEELRTRFRTLYVHVGRIAPEKNHDLLLAAAKRLQELRDDFAIVCVGDGYGRDRIESESRRLGLEDHIFLIGARQNPFPFVAKADALVLTSRLESFGLVLAEAMACGTPVVSVDAVGGVREVLQDGACGLLVERDDAQALAAAMNTIVSDGRLRKRLVEAGFRRAETLDIRNVAREWERMIDDFLPDPSVKQEGVQS